jgi:UDP-N-acetylglucosamine--N-acetylmuramyl-(pentapeptide) pyrophosphoryl-undecaprenol N-acetylglucosamine transferase
MRVIMTGCGTGGHIYPAIAIADEIKRRYPNAEILFVGAERGLEKTLVPKRGYDIRLITVEGFDRKNLVRNVSVIRKLMKGSAQARKIIRDFRPDFVVGTGGYASAPMVKAAQKAHIPTFIHEQNAYPGVTNKLLEKNVNTVFLGFERAAEYFKDQKKMVVSGNPVRDEFRNRDRKEARKALGFEENRFIVLAFGGSFPDGLCGGLLAYSMDAPLLLVVNGRSKAAADYAVKSGMSYGAVLGGPGLIDNATAKSVFGLDANADIVIR